MAAPRLAGGAEPHYPLGPEPGVRRARPVRPVPLGSPVGNPRRTAVQGFMGSKRSINTCMGLAAPAAAAGTVMVG